MTWAVFLNGLKKPTPPQNLKRLHARWEKALLAICSNPHFIEKVLLRTLEVDRLQLLDIHAKAAKTYSKRNAIEQARLQAATYVRDVALMDVARFWSQWKETESLVRTLQFKTQWLGEPPATSTRPWMHKNLTVWFADGTLYDQKTMLSIGNSPPLSFLEALKDATRHAERLRKRANTHICTITNIQDKIKAKEALERQRGETTRQAVEEIERWQMLLRPQHLAVPGVRCKNW